MLKKKYKGTKMKTEKAKVNPKIVRRSVLWGRILFNREWEL